MLTNKANQTIALLVGTNVVSYICGVTLIRELAKEKRRYNNLWNFTGYLMSKLEESGIELTEFDLIALRTLSGEHDATE